MTVARIMKDKVGKVITAGPNDSIQAVAARLTRHLIGALVVLDEQGGIAGIITQGDVVRALAAGQAYDACASARDIMRPCELTCAPDDSEADLLDLMSGNHIQHLPVISGGQLAGIVSLGDVVRLRRAKISDMLQTIEREAEHGRFTANLKRRPRASAHAA